MATNVSGPATNVAAEFPSMGIKRRLRRLRRGRVRHRTRMPAGPIPLAARGLAAVLARTGPAGEGRHEAGLPMRMIGVNRIKCNPLRHGASFRP
jgi:hypothetical protein